MMVPALQFARNNAAHGYQNAVRNIMVKKFIHRMAEQMLRTAAGARISCKLHGKPAQHQRLSQHFNARN